MLWQRHWRLAADFPSQSFELLNQPIDLGLGVLRRTIAGTIARASLGTILAARPSPAGKLRATLGAMRLGSAALRSAWSRAGTALSAKLALPKVTGSELTRCKVSAELRRSMRARTVLTGSTEMARPAMSPMLPGSKVPRPAKGARRTMEAMLPVTMMTMPLEASELMVTVVRSRSAAMEAMMAVVSVMMTGELAMVTMMSVTAKVAVMMAVVEGGKLVMAMMTTWPAAMKSMMAMVSVMMVTGELVSVPTKVAMMSMVTVVMMAGELVVPVMASRATAVESMMAMVPVMVVTGKLAMMAVAGEVVPVVVSAVAAMMPFEAGKLMVTMMRSRPAAMETRPAAMEAMRLMMAVAGELSVRAPCVRTWPVLARPMLTRTVLTRTVLTMFAWAAGEMMAVRSWSMARLVTIPGGDIGFTRTRAVGALAVLIAVMLFPGCGVEPCLRTTGRTAPASPGGLAFVFAKRLAGAIFAGMILAVAITFPAAIFLGGCIFVAVLLAGSVFIVLRAWAAIAAAMVAKLTVPA